MQFQHPPTVLFHRAPYLLFCYFPCGPKVERYSDFCFANGEMEAERASSPVHGLLGLSIVFEDLTPTHSSRQIEMLLFPWNLLQSAGWKQSLPPPNLTPFPTQALHLFLPVMANFLQCGLDTYVYNVCPLRRCQHLGSTFWMATETNPNNVICIL